MGCGHRGHDAQQQGREGAIREEIAVGFRPSEHRAPVGDPADPRSVLVGVPDDQRIIHHRQACAGSGEGPQEPVDLLETGQEFIERGALQERARGEQRRGLDEAFAVEQAVADGQPFAERLGGVGWPARQHEGGAGRTNHDSASHDRQPRRRGRARRELAFQLGREPFVIVVQERHKRAPRLRDAHVARRAGALVRCQLQIAAALIGQALDRLAGARVMPIGHHEDLQRRHGLAEGRGRGAGDEGRSPERRDDDADRIRRLHRG